MDVTVMQNNRSKPYAMRWYFCEIYGEWELFHYVFEIPPTGKTLPHTTSLTTFKNMLIGALGKSRYN